MTCLCGHPEKVHGLIRPGTICAADPRCECAGFVTLRPGEGRAPSAPPGEA